MQREGILCTPVPAERLLVQRLPEAFRMPHFPALLSAALAPACSVPLTAFHLCFQAHGLQLLCAVQLPPAEHVAKHHRILPERGKEGGMGE